VSGIRQQTACILTVRLRWGSAAGADLGGWATFTCAEDEEMALTAASAAAERAPAADVLVGVDVSPTGGRDDDWRGITLRSEGWPCKIST
jgi:hypothetical protein